MQSYYHQWDWLQISALVAKVGGFYDHGKVSSILTAKATSNGKAPKVSLQRCNEKGGLFISNERLSYLS